MSLSAGELDFTTFGLWRPKPIERSAEYAVDLTRYRAPRVFLIPISCAERDGEVLTAVRPVAVEMHEADGGVTAENENLQVYACGTDSEEALSDFRSQLIELYCHYASLRDDQVTGEAERLRRLFLDNFELR